jgi:glutamine phosphoribosylpyrophosphate amidotransferase
MCAIIGIVLNKPSEIEFETFCRVLRESRIRGLHATGISWASDGNLKTIKEPIPAEVFIDKHLVDFDQYIDNKGKLSMIAHCRYSTSDLMYNQPISNEFVSVVHNGVITQELPENWKRLYGYDCQTKNDTELLIHTVMEGKSPLEQWSESSIAAIELYADGKMRFYRNGKRPMYITNLKKGILITSTSDVVIRSGIEEQPSKIAMNCYNTIQDNYSIMKERIEIYGEIDYQV